MKLIDNWRKAWRFLSMQLLALALVLQTAWETLPADALAVIPADWRGYITLGLIVLAMVGRLIQQGKAE